jgi:geranylgeranyl pyrophosphate synthase
LLLLPDSTSLPTQASLGEIRQQAEELGMPVLAAHASGEVLRLISRGAIDAIVGVADLDTLELAIDRILLAGIPAVAVPTLPAKEEAAPVDFDWAQSMLVHKPAPAATHSRYHSILQTTCNLFRPGELRRHLPQYEDPQKAATNGSDAGRTNPLLATQQIACDFLELGGKYARPFITLAAYDAMTRDANPVAVSPPCEPWFPDAVLRVALSIESFHKASLVHDDIEDDDQFRYGQPALHRKYGVSTAINIGDYLIGLGYRLVSRESGTLGPEVTGDILDILADAHLRLSAGQGAELLWRDARDKRLKPADALRIYALKTSPAFEAALLSGLRCAGPIDESVGSLRQFCEHLGIAFQILNDLQDWVGDTHNKCGAGLDVLGGRPTLLWSLAMTHLSSAEREELLQLVDSPLDPAERIQQVRTLYLAADVFQRSHELVEQHQVAAVQLAQAIEPAGLKNLLLYLIDVVLQGSQACHLDALTTPCPS